MDQFGTAILFVIIYRSITNFLLGNTYPPISICKLKHNKVEGVAKFVSSFQINGTDDLAATSIIANIDGHIIIGTKSYSKSSPATVFLLKDNGDDITLENSWKFDESSDTINCIRFDENIAYFVNRNSPAEIMSINVTKENSYEQIYHVFSNNSSVALSRCHIWWSIENARLLALHSYWKYKTQG